MRVHTGGMARSDSTRTKLMATSGSLAVIVFFVLGFVFDAWAWAWVVFLVPGVVTIWFGDDEPSKKQVKRDAGQSSAPLPPGHEGEDGNPPPPQRYQG